jgi:hypothetical protein
MIDPSTVDWDAIADTVYRRLSMGVEIDNRPFPQKKLCEQCGNEYMQKRREQRLCSTSCTAASQRLPAGEAVERARQRFREWYSLNKAKHIANVAERKKGVTTSPGMQLSNTSSGVVAAPGSLSPSESSSPCLLDPASSSTSTLDSTIGGDLSRCA